MNDYKLSEDELQKAVAYRLDAIVTGGHDTMSHIAREMCVCKNTIKRIRDRTRHPKIPADVSFKMLIRVANYLGIRINQAVPMVMVDRRFNKKFKISSATLSTASRKRIGVSTMKRIIVNEARTYKDRCRLSMNDLAEWVDLDAHTVKEMLSGRSKRNHRWSSWVKLSMLSNIEIISDPLYSVDFGMKSRKGDQNENRN